jgi:ribosomal protein S18 acetylase RimI-like enzyme
VNGAEAGGVVRAARPDDAQAIAEVHVATWREAYAGLLPDELLAGLDVAEWAGRWRDRLSAPPDGMFTLVFEADGHVRGFVSGGPSRDGFPGGEVHAIYLDPRCQGRGTGRQMLEAATRLLADAGFAAASLWVVSGNHAARGFYEAQGWRRDGTEHQWPAADGISVPEVRYVRKLNGRTGAR